MMMYIITKKHFKRQTAIRGLSCEASQSYHGDRM